MRRFFQILGGVALLSASFLSFAATPAEKGDAGADKQVQQAQVLVQSGKFKEAYELLQPLEFELAGNLQYDYLLGVSAVNAGKPDRATIALERIVATNPDYGDAQQWLAIAYFQSGDMERAKREFNVVLSKNPSPQVKNTASQYLAAIRQQEEAKELAEKKAHQPYLVGMVELGVGRDGNILPAPPNDYSMAYQATTGSVPTAATFVPTGISESYRQLNGNVEGRIPFAGAGTYGYVIADSSNRAYQSSSMMNSHTNLVKGGVNLVSGKHTYRFDISRRSYRQEGAYASQGSTSNNTQNSFSGDARFTLGERDYLGVNVQYNMPRFTTIPTQNTNQTVLGTNYTHVFPNKGSPMVYFALNHTRDRAQISSDQYLFDGTAYVFPAIKTDVSRNTNAFIAYTQYTFVESADVTAMWMGSRRIDTTPYARSGVLELANGKDLMHVTMLGMNWRPAKNWVVHPQWMRIRNASNIPLYSYQKNEISISVKREFK